MNHNKQTHKGSFTAIAFLIMALTLAVGSLQSDAAAASCGFTVSGISGGIPLDNAFGVGGSGTCGPNDQLNISGDPTFSGSCGNVHTNGCAKLNGNPNLSSLTYGDSLVGGCPSSITSAGGSCTQDTSDISPPEINVSDFMDYVEYQLTANGKVKKRTAGPGPYTYTEIGDCQNKTGDCSSGKWRGWDFNRSNVLWKLSSCDTEGSDANDTEKGCMHASYFVEGTASVSASAGTAATPWEISFFATGTIDFSGGGYFSRYSGHAKLGNIFLLADYDIDFSGNPQQAVSGIIGAGEDISISGNPDLNGCLFTNGRSASSSGPGKDVKQDAISGNPTINCDSNCSWPTDQAVTITDPF